MKKIKRSQIFPIVIFCLIFFYLDNQLSNQFSGRVYDQIEGMLQYYYVLAMDASMLLFVLFNPPRLRFKLVKTFYVLLISIVLVSFLLSLIYSGFTLITYFSILFPLMTLLFVNSAIERMGKDRLLIIVFFMVVLLGVHYFVQYYRALAFLQVEQLIINAGYYLLLFVPLVLCIDNRILKYGATIFIAITILSSGKRGGIVALGLSLIMFFLFRSLSSQKQRRSIPFFTLIISLVVFAGASFFLFDYFDQLGGNMLSQRFMTMQETGGSNRTDIYNTTIEMISASNLPSLLLGHGWNGVLNNSPLKCSAHNDFLEVFYDFGLFVFIIYISTYVSMIKQLRAMSNAKSKYTGQFACALAIFITISMVSHIVLYPPMLMIEMIVFYCLVYFYNLEIYENRDFNVSCSL